MMNKIITLVAVSGLLFSAGSGCSNKPDPTPEETALLRANGGKRAGFVGNSDEDLLLNSNVIEGEPLDGLVGRDIDLTDYDDGDFARGLFDPVYFGFDQYAVDPGERTKLMEVADFLKRETGSRLIIEGHCDWKGTPEYNKSLGDRRATNVRQYLIDLAVDPDRIDIVSKGDETALTEATADQMRLDRRAQFVVIKGS
jgi:peptidoglycan-associated lipoprotein